MSPLPRLGLRRPAVPARPAGPPARGASRPAADARPLRFFRDVRGELNKVTWPSPEEAKNLTIVVLAVSVVVGVFLGAVDWLFAKIFEFLLRVL